jgi:hypothetical protein
MQPKVDGVNLTTATTLQRHLEDHIKSGKKTFTYTNKCAIWTVFSGEERGPKFVDYITRTSNMDYGLSRKKVVELPYEFAKETSKNYLKSWDMNGRASEQWFIDFMKHNNNVPTSVAARSKA